MQKWYKKLIEFLMSLFAIKVAISKPKEYEETEGTSKVDTKSIYEIKTEELDNRLKRTNNVERFPDNVFKPEVIEVDGDYYNLYKFRFSSIDDLYEYLKAEPDINIKTFGNHLSSEKGSYEFAGVKYPTARERLIEYNDPKYQEFLEIASNAKVKNLELGSVFRTVNSVSGGIVRPQAIATGDPYLYRATKTYIVEKNANLHVMAAYLCDTNKKQVYHRAVILTNIINALEKEGINVDVDVFMTASNKDEIIEIELRIKKQGRQTDYQSLYKSLCNVEFLRRILFRVIESSEVVTDWNHGYGTTVDENFIRVYKDYGKEDYYFGTPAELGIRGREIGEDFENAVTHIGLQDAIDVEEAKKRIRMCIKK